MALGGLSSQALALDWICRWIMRQARGAYQIGLPNRSRADQCFPSLQRLRLSQTRMVKGLSNRSYSEVVGNPQDHSEQLGKAGKSGWWENAATKRTHSRIRPFVGRLFNLFFFSFFLFSVVRRYSTFPGDWQTHKYGSKLV